LQATTDHDLGKAPRDLLYGDGKAGERIADCLASAPLTVEKRLTY